MIGLAKTIIPFALVFGAIALLSAFALSRACSVGIGRRVARPVDPYLHPFGEITPLPAGSIIELHEHSHSVGLATRADQGSGGDGKTSQGAAAARFLFRDGSHFPSDRALTAEELVEIKERWNEQFSK